MSDISNQAAQAASDAVMSKVATGMTVGGGGTAFVGGLTRHSEGNGWRQRVAIAIRSALLDNIDPNGVRRG